MALNPDALITLNEFKRYADIVDKTTNLPVTSTKDAFIEDCINEASSSVNEFCNRSFADEAITEFYDGTGSNILSLRSFPVSALTLLKVQASDGTLTDLLESPDTIADTVEFTSTGISLLKGYTFPVGESNIKVTYSGFASVPGAVKKVCKEIAMLMFKESKAGEDRLGVRSETKGTAASISKSYDLTSEKLLERLIPFRRLNVARAQYSNGAWSRTENGIWLV